jgi:cation diffusion facilitator CzcD-associated flavoprotein CzcO
MSTPRVAIVGGGFSGIGMGIALKRAGIDSFTILERADRIGGVWRDNTYPGAACDVPSHLYSYSFEPNHLWSRRFSPQPEILAYLERCVEKYRLAEHLRLGAAVTAAEFDEHRGRWTLRTAAGEKLEAEALVAASGQLSRPVRPPLAGLERFEGPAFHSARWDHDLDLRGKRVAVIGTGASAIQFVPRIAPLVERLHLFQRSAPYVIPKPDRPYRGWQRRLWRRFPQLQAISRFYVWGLLEVFIAGFIRTPRVMSVARRGFERQLREQIPDPELRRALTPDYEMGCKRILVSSEYYEALARPNVEVVTDPVREVRASGVVDASGVERAVDAIIFGTGFAANDFLAPMEVRGLGGRELNQAWRDGAEAYLGICVSGFPNMFILYGPNTNLGAGSIIYMLEQQIAYSVAALSALSGSGAAYLDLREDVQRRFSRELQRRLDSTVWQSGCTSWYVNEAGRNVNNWPGFMSEYRRRTARLDLEDYRLVPAA